MNWLYLPDILLVAAAIVTAQFIVAPWVPRALFSEMIAKNPAWAEAHSDVVHAMAPKPILKPASYVIGTGLLISTVPALKSNMPLMYLAYIAMLSFMGIVVVVAAFDGMNLYRLRRLIPSADTREADLIPRKLTAYVPRSIAYGGLALFAMSIFGWMIIPLLNPSPTDERLFQGGLISSLIVGPIAFLLLQYHIRRRTKPADRIPRKTEVRFAFFVIVALSIANLVRLAAATSEYPWFVERVTFLVGLCAWISAMLWLALNKRYPVPKNKIR